LNVLKPGSVDTARTKHHEDVKEGRNDRALPCHSGRLDVPEPLKHLATKQQVHLNPVVTRAAESLDSRTGSKTLMPPFANTGKQVQSLFTLVHAQFALTNSLLQYVLTCVVEPPEEVLPAARARAKARYAKILRLAGEEVAMRNQATLEQVLTHSKQQ